MNSSERGLSGEHGRQNGSDRSFVLGLTGGIGTGKSTAAGYLLDRGFEHVDADAISRSLTADGSPMLQTLDETFGPEGPFGIPGRPVLLEPSEEGGAMRLDRKALADLVFHDPEKKKELDRIMHGAIREIIEERIRSAQRPVLLDVPLLFESGLDRICDHVLLITADLPVRLRRVTERDGVSEEHVLARIRSQMDDAEKIARADTVIDNSGDLEELYRQLDQAMETLEPACGSPAC